MDNSYKIIKEMGYRISMRRKELGLTQETLAELADVSPQLISNAENGQRAISSDKLFRISRALNTSSDYLLSGEKTDADKEKELSLLSESLKSATPEQAALINQIANLIIDNK